MLFNSDEISSTAFYHIMAQAIIPRPIAWVLSRNPNGTFNVAPFSFFNGVASEPPIIMLSVGWKDDTTRKDTWINIEERDYFVVHIPPVELSAPVVATSAPLLFNSSEIEHANLTTTHVDGWPLVRIIGPKVAMLCHKYKIIELGEDKQGLILGEIKSIWADDGIVTKKDDRFILDPQKISPLARLGGNAYSTLGNVFDIKRPK
jgi:flavin reductase (DIM6/NTAB) family NADH-FMN oxidoreductase RutF